MLSAGVREALIKKNKKRSKYGHCQKYWSTFLGLMTTLDFFLSAGRKNSVQKPDTFSEANKIKFYAVLSHFAKCCDLRVKVLHDSPK